MVNDASPGPAPAFQARASNSLAHPVQLADVAPGEAAQEGAQGSGWRFDYAAESAGRPAGAQHRRRRCSPARQRRGDQRHYLGRCWLGLGPGPGQVPVNVGKGRGARPRWREESAALLGGGRRRRCGCRRVGCVVGVLLVSGRFSVSKPLSQIQRRRFFSRPLTRPRSVDWGLGGSKMVDE